MRVAVLGATGTVGRALVPRLAETHDVVAVARRPGVATGVEWIRADVSDAADVRRALDAVDVAYYLVHSLGARDFERRDRLAARTAARAAADAGVRQLVYLGGLGDDRSAHLRSRHETGQELASAGVPLTVLRSAVVVGPGSAAFETIVALVERLPAMLGPRWLRTRTQPIALADAVAYLAGVAGVEASFGDSFDVGGPEVMTYRGMIERIAALLGRRTRILEVPVLTPRLSSLWLHLVTPVRAAQARPLVEGLRSETVVRDERIRELVPLKPTAFDVAARAALAART